MKLFVSYSHDGTFLTRGLAAVLRMLGDGARRDVWQDQQLVGAELWWAAILDQIEACQCFVVILTPHSAASIYCTTALAYAQALHKPVLALVLKCCFLTPALNNVQLEDITDIWNLPPEQILLRLEQVRHAIEIRAMQNMHEPPATPPDRPPLPEPDVRLEGAFVSFAEAEEAFAAGNEELAAFLYQEALESDPAGLGAKAASRLADIRYARSRASAYAQLEWLVTNPATREGAKAAWKVYVARYGKVYDPNHYAALLTDPLEQTAPLSSDRLPPKPVLLTVDTVILSAHGAEVPPGPSFTLPMLEWCDIPAGVVAIEGGGVYRVEAFRMAKYPVTNAQFQVFVDSPDGYSEPAWWSFSDMALRWRRDNATPAESAFKGDMLPREMVCWYEAMAFCRWLAAKTGLPITLPTQMQWQRAAQGDDGREYPWGNEFDKAKCNTIESDIRRATPVDRYPQGGSPYGVLDMSGNVWEWCLNEFSNLDEISINSANSIAVRGGSWFDLQGLARAACCSAYHPADRSSLIGFRVVAAPVSSSDL